MRLGKGCEQIALINTEKPVHDKIKGPCGHRTQEDGHDHHSGDEGLIIVDLAVKVDVSHPDLTGRFPYGYIFGTGGADCALNRVPYRFGRYPIRVIKEESHRRPVFTDYIFAEVRRDDKRRFIFPFSHPFQGFRLILHFQYGYRLWSGGNCLQIFHNASGLRPGVLIYYDHGKPLQFSLKGVADNDQIDKGHEYAHCQHNGVPPEFFQVPFYNGKQSCHSSSPPFAGYSRAYKEADLLYLFLSDGFARIVYKYIFEGLLVY